MFDWLKFQQRALSQAADLCSADKELAKIIALNGASSKTDWCGRPLPGNTLINQLQSLSEFIRILELRKAHAGEVGDHAYCSYAESVLRFLKALPPDEKVFVINIGTKNGNYEFMDSGGSQRLFFARVDQLEGRGKI